MPASIHKPLPGQADKKQQESIYVKGHPYWAEPTTGWTRTPGPAANEITVEKTVDPAVLLMHLR